MKFSVEFGFKTKASKAINRRFTQINADGNALSAKRIARSGLSSEC